MVTATVVVTMVVVISATVTMVVTMVVVVISATVVFMVMGLTGSSVLRLVVATRLAISAPLAK